MQNTLMAEIGNFKMWKVVSTDEKGNEAVIFAVQVGDGEFQYFTTAAAAEAHLEWLLSIAEEEESYSAPSPGMS